LALINVMHVFDNFGLGGAQRIFLTTASQIRRDRFQVIVCCLGEPGILVPEAAAQELHAIALRRLQASNDWGTVWALARLMRQQGVHVVQSFLYSRASLYARLAARMAGVPVVIAIEVGPAGRRPLKKRLADGVLRVFTDHFIALSQATKAQTIALQGVLPDRVSVIYPGVDPSRFEVAESRDSIRQSLSIPADAPVIGTVARLDPVKGHVYLLEAMPIVLKPFPRAYLVLVGAGPADDELRRRAKELGLAQAIVFTGARRDVPRLLHAMDVFVLPSLREGFGFALLEAMTCRVPIVATRVGGIPEVVGNGHSGILVPAADPVALGEAVIRLLQDDDLREAMGRAGYEQVMAQFTAQRAANETEQLYARLLDAKGIQVPPAQNGAS
jgi:glycosyltransferase involved in cell wall biosynthesis